MPKKFTYIDLFSGCGGLSLGLEKAGFELELAVEKSDMAAETFYHNFIERIQDQQKWSEFSSPKTSVQSQAKQRLVVKELREVLDCKDLIKSLKKKEIDLIAGGPPCQGFSLAGKRNPNDVRNQLPWQFLELVDQVHPKAVIIENVSGITQNFVKHNEDAPFEQLRKALMQAGPGYRVQPVMLNAMHFGVPQHRPRAMLLGIRKDIADKLVLTIFEETWKSEYDQVGSLVFAHRPSLAPTATHFGNDILGVKDAIWDLDDRGHTHTPSSKKYQGRSGSFAKEMREDDSWMPPAIKKSHRPSPIKNHTLRNHAEQIKLRFRLYQYLRDNNIPSRILNIPKNAELSPHAQVILIKEFLQGCTIPARSPDGQILAKNRDELVKLISGLGTKKHSQRPLKWDSPSPTVVSLPDDFVHPDIPRTLTVRELARFQSFPDSFEFRAKETTGSLRRRIEVPQYTQVGNAVPPKLALAVGSVFYKILERVVSLSEEKKIIKKTG
jgi:DNA (cytosine-5)-methyltransferase 1